jgi:hypothetical protein
MAWNTPPTFTTGQLIGASDLNSYIRDNTNYLLGGRVSGTSTKTGSANTSSNTFADIDSTDLSVTITTVGSVALVVLNAQFFITIASSASNLHVDVAVDGTRIEREWNLAVNTGTTFSMASFCVFATGLTAGSHTFRPQWKVDAAAPTPTATIGQGNSSYLYVREIG